MSKEYFDAFGMFDQFFSDFGITNDFFKNFSDVYKISTFPPVNILMNKETKEIVYQFAVAGYNKNNISITFSGDYMELLIKKSPVDLKYLLGTEGWEYANCGIKNADVYTKYYCPADKYSRENVVAKLNDGILTIKLSPVKKVETKSIKIE